MAHRSGNSRMRKSWFGIPGASLALTADSTNIGNGLAFSAPATVLRMLGNIVMGPTSAPSALDEALITVGIGVFSTDAFALGATAMPDPTDEPEYPWLYWASHRLWYPSTSVQTSVAVGTRVIEFDIRSMRKISDRQTLGVVVQYTDVVGAPAIHVGLAAFRVLAAVP